MDDRAILKELPDFVVREGDLLIGMSGSLGKIARYQELRAGLTKSTNRIVAA